MTALTTTSPTTIRSTAGRAGKRIELARYTLPDGTERVLYGQRVDGVVRVSDHPASGHGRAVLVERELELDGNAALHAMLTDYVEQARKRGRVPMLVSPLDRYLENLE